MGFMQYKTPGRPTADCEKMWVDRCNFVIRVQSTASTLDNATSGWMVQLETHDVRTYMFVSCDDATSTISLRKRCMRAAPGLVARLTSEDFFEMVEEDAASMGAHILLSVQCGYVPEHDVWLFPNMTLDAKGNKVTNAMIMMHKASALSTRISSKCVGGMPRSRLKRLGEMTMAFYQARSVHALHVYSTALKSVLRDQIMKAEHMMPITNLSGPPNVGKTFASAIALRMRGTDDLMLSRVTPSSLLDMCDHHQNMLIVWDDPREASHKDLCSIVHEAFHGFPNSTVSKGLRRYNSCIIIGTQKPLLGLPEHATHTPTFSRLAHIDMNIDEAPPTHTSSSAQKLAKCMEDLEATFPLLLRQTYDKALTDELYAELCQRAKGYDIIDRTLRVAAVEWNMCLGMNALGLGFDEDAIATYFLDDYVQYLRRHCSSVTPLQQLIRDCKQHLHRFSPSELKLNVLADLKEYGTTECVAVHLRSVFTILKGALRDLPYSMESIQNEIKSSKEYGELNRNVNYRDGKQSVVRRSVLIRKRVWDTFA